MVNDKLAKVRAEIERRRNRHSKAKRIESALEDNAILSFIDSMQKEPVSKGLKEEIKQYCIHHGYLDSLEDCGYTFNEQVGDIACHFANWQKEQMIRQLENIVYRRYSPDGGSEQRNKDLIKLIQNWKCQDGV